MEAGTARLKRCGTWGLLWLRQTIVAGVVTVCWGLYTCMRPKLGIMLERRVLAHIGHGQLGMCRSCRVRVRGRMAG